MDTSEPRELGTLIVVVGKARNLPNKSRFGKQDPFCTLQILEEKKRTRTIKRGGQHPEWDDELRFTIMEELEDILKMPRSESTADSTISSSHSLASVASTGSPGVTTAQALAAKSRKPPKRGGGKSMRVACYADDPKEPELIGDCYVQIDEVLKKGEVDEWYEFNYKEKYVGEIYLELTFYSNNAPPVKRNVPKPAVQHVSHGSGNFNDGTFSSSSSLSGRLPTSGSASGMNLYIPPYSQQAVAAPSHQPSTSFGDLGLPPGHIAMQPQGVPPGSVIPNGYGDFAPQAPTQMAPTNPSLDSLTRPFSSMSIGAPATPPTAIPPSESTTGLNRHSIGVSNAPWTALLPQSQVQIDAPHQRPMSTNDAFPWEQAKRLEDERSRGGATPVPRPMSGQGFGPTTPGSTVKIRPGDTLPATLLPGPSTSTPAKHHAHSFSYADRPVTSLLHSTSPSPAPMVPPLASSAPPFAHPQHDASPGAPVMSSFDRVAQAINASAQSSPHGQTPFSSRRTSLHESYQASPTPYQATPPRPLSEYRPSIPSTTPGPTPPNLQGYSLMDSGARQAASPSPLPRNHTPTPAQSFTPQHQATPPVISHRPSLPNPQQYNNPPTKVSTTPPNQQHSTPSGSYVPWYQQTQSAMSQNSPRMSTPTPLPPTQPLAQATPPPRPAFGPPPVPSRRPVPTPPGPPPPGKKIGYYPSDELYARTSDISEVYSTPPSQRPVSPLPPQPMPQQQNLGASPDPNYQWNAQKSHSPILLNRPPEQSQQYSPNQSQYATVQQPQPIQNGQYTSYNVDPHQQSVSAPPIPTQRPQSTVYYDSRTTTPAPPSTISMKYNQNHNHTQPYNDQQASHHPTPPRHPYAQAQSAPPLPPPRSSTPQPRPPVHPQSHFSNDRSTTPLIPPTSQVIHTSPIPASGSTLGYTSQHPPLHSSGHENIQQNGYLSQSQNETGSQGQSQGQGNRNSWKSYMQNLSTPSLQTTSTTMSVSMPGAMPGAYDPSSPIQSQLRNEYESPGHSKPPAPEGWKSTLPAQVNGHRWLG